MRRWWERARGCGVQEFQKAYLKAHWNRKLRFDLRKGRAQATARCAALQRVALRCNVLCGVATCCAVLQSVVLCCNAFYCIAAHRCDASCRFRTGSDSQMLAAAAATYCAGLQRAVPGCNVQCCTGVLCRLLTRARRSHARRSRCACCSSSMRRPPRRSQKQANPTPAAGRVAAWLRTVCSRY